MADYYDLPEGWDTDVKKRKEPDWSTMRPVAEPSPGNFDLPPGWNDPIVKERQQEAELLLPYSDMVQAIIKNAPDAKTAQDDMDRIVSSAFLANRLQLPFAQVYEQHDAVAQEYWGKVTPPKTGRQAVAEAWKTTSLQQKIAMASYQQMMGDESPLLQQQIDLWRKQMPDPDTQQRAVPTEVFKAVANMLPYMWENWKWSIPRAAAGATVAAGVGVLAGPGAEVAIPALWVGYFTKGIVLGSAAYTFQAEAGMQYDAFMQAGVPKDIAKSLSLPVGAVNAALEMVQLYNIPGVKQIIGAVRNKLTRDVTRKVVVEGVLAKIASRFVGGAKTPVGRMARQAVAGMVEAQITQTPTEVAQEAVNVVADALGAEWSNATRGTNIPAATADEIKTRLVETYKQTAMAMLVIGLPGVVGTSLSQYTRGMTLEQKAIIQKEAAAQVAMPQQVAGKEAAAPPLPEAAYRTPEGLPFTVHEKREATAEGTNAILAVGNPETGERYGSLTYETIADRVYVQEVVNEGKEDYTRAMVMDLAAKHPGLEIEWNPTEDAQVAVKQELIATNPRGPDEGLQWFAAEGPEVQGILTRDVLKRKLITEGNIPMAEAERVSVLSDILAKNAGITTDEWINKYFGREVFAKGAAAKEDLVAHQAAAAVQFVTTEGRQVGAMEVDKEEFAGRVRGLFVTLGKSDFHHTVHEWFHIVERLALSKPQVRLMETALGKLRETWTTEDVEKLADHFEDYLGTGKAPTPELATVFQEIAAALKKLVSYIIERPQGDVQLSPEFRQAYDSLFAKPESGLAQAEAAPPVAPAPAEETRTPAQITQDQMPVRISAGKTMTYGELTRIAREGLHRPVSPPAEVPADLEIFHPEPKEFALTPETEAELKARHKVKRPPTVQELFDFAKKTGAEYKDDTEQGKLFHRNPEDQTRIIEAAVKMFGTTTDPNEAGYLLPDGRMLDFSGRHDMGRWDRLVEAFKKQNYTLNPADLAGKRALDHSELFMSDGSNPLGLFNTNGWLYPVLEFMSRSGAVRMAASVGMFHSVGMVDPAVVEKAMAPLLPVMNANAEVKGVWFEVWDEEGKTTAAMQIKDADVGKVQAFYDLARAYTSEAPLLREGAEGRFRPNELVLFHPEAIKEADPWLYKSLEVLNAKVKGPMPASQIKATMLSNGVKAEEMKWTGLDEFLAGDKKLTPEEVRQFIAENAVALVEVEKRQPDAREGGFRDETKFAKYQLPGGQNYRELLLTLQVSSESLDSVALQRFNKRYVELATSQRNAVQHIIDQEESGKTYKSPHWSEPNVIAHIRTNDRVNATEEGAPASAMLFVEEIQSDWHQKGREEGYRLTEAEERERSTLASKSPITEAEADRLEALNVRYEEAAKSGVPPAPFSKTWHELAFKRLLRMAVEQGYDAIGWTTGAQQAARYPDAMRQVADRIEWNTDESGIKEFVIKKDGGTTFSGLVDSDTGLIRDSTESRADGNTLAALLGKEMAARIGEDADGEIAGKDFVVGGAFMRLLYDKMLVDYANKVGKKFGAQVQEAQLLSGTWRLVDAKDNIMATMPSLEELEKIRPHYDGYAPLHVIPPDSVAVHSLPITSEMAQGIARGQYLFHYDPSLALEFLYGTSIDQGVYDMMVEEAEPYDSPEAFRKGVEDKYGEPREGDVAGAEAEAFWQEVWDAAHPTMLTTEQANAEFIDFLKAEDYKGVYAVLAAIGGEAKSTVPANRKGGTYAKRVALHGGLSPLMKSLAGRVANTGRDISPKSLKSMFTIMSKDPGTYRQIYAAALGDEAMQRQLQHEQELAPSGEAEVAAFAMPAPEAVKYDYDTKAEAAAPIADDALAAGMTTGEATPAALDTYVTTLNTDIATLRERLNTAFAGRDAALGQVSEADRRLIEQGENALAAEEQALEEGVTFAEGMQKSIDAYKARLAELETSDKLTATKAKLYAEKRAALEKLRAQVRAKAAEKRAIKKYKEARARLLADIMRPPGKSIEYVGYAEQIREIQRGLDPKQRQKTTKERRAASRAFFDANPEAAALVPQERLDAIYSVPQVELPVKQLEEIWQVIDNLTKLGRLKHSIKVGQRMDEKRAKIAAVSGAVLRGRPPEKVIGAAKPSPKWFKAFALTWKPDRMSQLFDGWKETGPNRELLQDGVNEQWTKYRRSTRSRIEAGVKKMVELKLTMDALDVKRTTQGFEYLGAPMDIEGFRMSNGKSPTVEDAMYWYLGMKNEKTAAAILHGNNIPESVILKGVSQLTKNQLAMADWLSGEMDNHYGALRSAFIEVFNIDLAGEDNYVPMRRLERSYENLAEEVAAELTFRAGVRKEFIARHPTFERIEMADEHQKPIRTDLVGVWMDNVKTSEGFIHQYQMVRELQGVYGSDQVRASLRQRYGEAANKWVSHYINDLAQSDAYQAAQGIDKYSRMFRGNAAVSWLAFNILPNLKQLTGFIGYLGDAGPFHLAAAAAKFAAGQGRGVGGLLSNSQVDFAEANSELIRNRQIGQELEDLKRSRGGLYMQIVKKIGTAGMRSLEIIDKVTCVIGWTAVYDKTFAKTQSEAASIEAADKATVRTQPSARVQDMAELYRSGETMKWFTMFTSELSATWNRLSFDVPQAIRNKHVGRAVGDLVAFAMVGAGIAVASGALAGGDDEKKKKQMLLGLASQYINALPLVGNDLFNAISGQTFPSSGVSLLPAFDYVPSIISDMKDADFWEAVKDFGEAVAFLSGLPVSGPKKAIRFIGSGQPTDLLGWRVKKAQ